MTCDARTIRHCNIRLVQSDRGETIYKYLDPAAVLEGIRLKSDRNVLHCKYDTLSEGKLLYITHTSIYMFRTTLCSLCSSRLWPLAALAIKPMMSTVKDIVDEGLGDDFEDTPWVPPTVKRVRFPVTRGVDWFCGILISDQ